MSQGMSLTEILILFAPYSMWLDLGPKHARHSKLVN